MGNATEILGLLFVSFGVIAEESGTSVHGKWMYEQVNIGDTVEHVDALLGKPVSKLDRDRFGIQLFYSFPGTVGSVSGATLLVKNGLVVRKEPSYQYNKITNARWKVVAEFPGGDEWKWSYSDYIDGARVFIKLNEFGVEEHKLLIDAVVIPAAKIGEKGLSERFNPESAVARFIKSAYPSDVETVNGLKTMKEFVDFLNRKQLK